MDAFLNFPVARRREFCQAAGDKIGLDAVSVEKDFWVCLTLRELFSLEQSGPHLTFKGGTSLSKGWKLIERFSEDIDVVVERDFLGFGGDKNPQQQGISTNERNRRLEDLKSACQTHVQTKLKSELERAFQIRIPKELNWRLEVDADDIDGQTILFEYPSAFQAGNYLRPSVKVEMGARSDTEPSENPKIQPYLTEAFPNELETPSEFVIRTVAPERTFWEKAMLLHEETFRVGGEGPKNRLARHYYDLWCLIQKGIAEKAAADIGLFERVAAHRAVFFRRKKEAQESLRPGLLRILPLEGHLDAWRKDYEAMRDAMFFGNVPDFERVLEIVGQFERKFNDNGF